MCWRVVSGSLFAVVCLAGQRHFRRPIRRAKLQIPRASRWHCKKFRTNANITVFCFGQVPRIQSGAVQLGTATSDDSLAEEGGVKVTEVVYALSTESGKAGVRIYGAGAAVHLRDLPAGWKPGPPARPIELKFAKGRLTPEFACIQVGQKLVVKCPEGEVTVELELAPRKARPRG